MIFCIRMNRRCVKNILCGCTIYNLVPCRSHHCAAQKSLISTVFNVQAIKKTFVSAKKSYIMKAIIKQKILMEQIPHLKCVSRTFNSLKPSCVDGLKILPQLWSNVGDKMNKN